MARPEPGSGVPMEILVEEDVVAPVGIVLKKSDVPMERSTARLPVAEEKPDQAPG